MALTFKVLNTSYLSEHTKDIFSKQDYSRDINNLDIELIDKGTETILQIKWGDCNNPKWIKNIITKSSLHIPESPFKSQIIQQYTQKDKYSTTPLEDKEIIENRLYYFRIFSEFSDMDQFYSSVKNIFFIYVYDDANNDLVSPDRILLDSMHRFITDDQLMNLNNLTSQIQTITNQNTDIQNQFNVINSEISEIPNIKSEINNLTNNINLQTTDINNIKSEIANLGNTNNTDINQKITDINTQITNLNNSDTNINTKIDSINTQVTNLNTDINTKIDSINTQLTNLNTSNTDFNQKITDITNQVANLNTNDTNFNQKITDITTQINNLNTDNTNINTQINSITNQITNLNTSNTDFSQKITDITNQITNLNTNNTDFSQKITDINTQITSLNASDVTINNKIDSINAQISNLSNNTDFNQKITDINTQITNLNTDNTNINNKIDSINTQIINLNASDTNINTKIDSINTQITDLNTNNTNINQKITDMNTQVANLNTNDININQKLTDLNTSDTNINAKIDSINTQISEITLTCPKGEGNFATDTKNFQDIINNAPWGSKINLYDSYYIENIQFKSGLTFVAANEVSLYIKGTLTLDNCEQLRFYNVRFSCLPEDDDPSKYLIHLYNSHNFLFDNCNFISGKFLTTRTILYGSNTYYGRFNNCRFLNYYEKDSNNCMVYSGMACELDLFNSSIFNDCVFGCLTNGIKVSNTQFLSIDGCNFEHINTNSIEVTNSDSIIIDKSYFETVWNVLLDPVTWQWTTKWVNDCNFIKLNSDTRNCRVSNSYFARPIYDSRDIRTLQFKCIINNAKSNIIENIGNLHEDLISSTSAITLLNSNPELLIQDNNGLPLGCSIDDDISIQFLNDYNFTFTTSKANTGLHYFFAPNKSASESCILIQLNTNQPVKFRRLRYTYNDSITEYTIPATNGLLNFSYDDFVVDHDNELDKRYIYGFEILNVSDVALTVSVNYIKVFNKIRPINTQVITSAVSNSAFLLSNTQYLDNYILNDKTTDNIIVDVIGNMFNTMTNKFVTAKNIKTLMGSELFDVDPNITMSYDSTLKETSMILSNNTLAAGYYACQHSVFIPDSVFNDEDEVDITVYFETKLVNPINTLSVSIGMIANYASDASKSYEGNVFYDIYNKFYTPIKFTMKVNKQLTNVARILITFNVKQVGDIGGIKFKNFKISFNGNQGLNVFTSTVPNAGNNKKGDKFANSDLSTGYIGYICTETGNPGTWKGFGQMI